MKFVAADPLTGDVSIAAQIAAQTLGPEFKQWLNDPQKLLQLIAAAEGANAGGGQAAAGGSSDGPAGQRAQRSAGDGKGKMGCRRRRRRSGNRGGAGMDWRNGSPAGSRK